MSKLIWRGEEVFKIVQQHGKAIMAEIGLVAEGYAKKELSKGHGLLTGTLRRSIHAAAPGYAWSTDTGSSELGGKKVEPEKKKGKWTVELGSGLSYALAIHQGWSGVPFRGQFAGYHYLTRGVDKAKADVPAIIARNKIK